MKDKPIPPARFEEADADRLIATFGKEPTAEEQGEILKRLQSEKERFAANEKQRDARSKIGPERGI